MRRAIGIAAAAALMAVVGCAPSDEGTVDLTAPRTVAPTESAKQGGVAAGRAARGATLDVQGSSAATGRRPR